MVITATEFKTKFGKYIEFAQKEDLFLTKNGKVVLVISKPNDSKIDDLNSLRGIIRDNKLSLDDIKNERLKRQWGYYLTQMSF